MTSTKITANIKGVPDSQLLFRVKNGTSLALVLEVGPPGMGQGPLYFELDLDITQLKVIHSVVDKFLGQVP
jgi:hypothetical protein